RTVTRSVSAVCASWLSRRLAEGEREFTACCARVGVGTASVAAATTSRPAVEVKDRKFSQHLCGMGPRLQIRNQSVKAFSLVSRNCFARGSYTLQNCHF